MARETNSLRPAFDDEDLLLEEEEETTDPEPENETDNGQLADSQDEENDPDDSEEVDYLAELAERQKKKKQLRKLEREIKEKPTVRKTFLVEEDLLNIILKLSEKYGYSFQVKFINSAIKRELKRIGHYPPKKRMG